MTGGPRPRVARLLGGYLMVALGLWLLIAVVWYLTPWSLLFAPLLLLGVRLSGEEA